MPLIEGTLINTKFGDIDTSHILFICSGAFSNSKPSDLMPELLGRLPIRINLKSLTKKEFAQILRTVEFGLIEQYQKLLETEGIDVKFEEETIDWISQSKSIERKFLVSIETILIFFQLQRRST